MWDFSLYKYILFHWLLLKVFYPIRHKKVISEMLFLANLLTGIEKMKSKPEQQQKYTINLD